MSEEKMKRVILIGRSMAGKTTLCQYISRQDLKYNKTQTVEVVNGTMIDTPGEYLERTNLRGALTVLSCWYSRPMKQELCFRRDIPVLLQNHVSGW